MGKGCNYGNWITAVFIREAPNSANGDEKEESAKTDYVEFTLRLDWLDCRC